MLPEADLLADRRRLRRKLTLWRSLSLLGLAIGAIVIGLMLKGKGMVPGLDSQHVARIAITGVITGDKRTLDMIKRAEESTASAVIVQIDSPGGTVTGSEAVYDALRKLATKKPTISTVDSTGASGAYIAALGTDRILARQTSIVGSIGVIFQYPEAVKLLETVGVKIEAVRSSPLKAMPSGLEPTTPEARAAMQKLVNDHYDWFKGLVKTRRNMSDPELAAVVDGRVHAGKQALALKLIDAVGAEPEARVWLAKEKNISEKLPVRDYKRRSENDAFGLLGDASDAAQMAGFATLSRWLARAGRQIETLSLDGSLALWQPRSEN
jgi:protease IV